MFFPNRRAALVLVCWMWLLTPALFEVVSTRALALWCAAGFLFWPLTLCRPLLLLGMVCLCALGTINVLHIGFFGNLADQLFIATALRTNWQEAQEFSGILPAPWVMVALLWLLISVMACRVLWVDVKHAAPQARKLAWAGCLVWVVFLIFVVAKRYDTGEVARKLKTIYPMHIVRAWTAQQQLTEGLFYAPQLPSAEANAPQVDTLVVVIGESASAQRWSLLGYTGADTNKTLAQVAGLQVARAMAHGFNTAAALPYLLTGMTAQDSVARKAPSFLDIARQAGYKTFVVSNSRYHSSVEDFYGVTFRRAADVFLKAGNGEFDAVLTPHLQNAIADPAPRKLIVLHTYGSHFQVEERYPKESAYFQDAYDNSLRYSSDLLAQWIAMLDNAVAGGSTAMMLYSSDHGVAMPPCADQYRTGSGLSSLEVPLLAWGNAALRTQSPQLLPQFSQAQRAWPMLSNATVADFAVAALGYPEALKQIAPPEVRALTFQGRSWAELQNLDACTLQ